MATSLVQHLWTEQGRWSQVADRLKRDLEHKRAFALALSIIGAVFSAAAAGVGLSSGGGKLLAFISAASVAIAGVVRTLVGKRAVQDWTRARSVSEAMKSEVYLHLAGVSDSRLDERIARIEDNGSDLLPHKATVTLRSRPLPPVHDVESYFNVRIRGQIDGFYRPRGRKLQRKVTVVRRIELALAVAGALLAAAGGTWERDALAIWVPVVTTVGAAITAHAAAARYEYLLIEYFRTAEQLERLYDGWARAGYPRDEHLLRSAEEVISAQNQGWMAELASEHEESPGTEDT